MEPNVMFLEKALDGRVAMDDISDALEEYTRLHKAGIASPAEILTLSRAYPENPIYAKALKKMNVNDDDSLVIGGPASIELVDREGHLITTAALDNAFQKYMSNFRTRNAMVLHSDVQVGWALPAYISKGGQIFKSGVDNKGLFFITELRNDTKIAKKVMEQINEGRLKSYSIAGSAVKTQTIQKGLQSVMQVDEMELAEVTVCEKGVNQGASFDIIKAENAATQSCVDGSCLIQKEESCGCESEPQGAKMIYKADGNIDFVKSFLNFVKPQSGALQKILLTEDNPEGLSFPTLINTQARQEEHHRLLDRYGFPEELEPEFARYTPVVEYNPNNSSPPWVVNEAGQNLGIRYYEEALTTPQIGTHTKRGVVEGANSNEVPVSELNSTDMFRNILSMITSQKAKEQGRPLAKQATDIKISKADDFFDWMARENKHIYKEDCPCEFCFQKNADYKGVVEKAIPLAAVTQALRRGAKKVATSRAAKEAGKGAAFMGGASLVAGGGRDDNTVQGSSVRNSVDLKKKDYNLNAVQKFSPMGTGVPNFKLPQNPISSLRDAAARKLGFGRLAGDKVAPPAPTAQVKPAKDSPVYSYRDKVYGQLENPPAKPSDAKLSQASYKGKGTPTLDSPSVAQAGKGAVADKAKEGVKEIFSNKKVQEAAEKVGLGGAAKSIKRLTGGYKTSGPSTVPVIRTGKSSSVKTTKEPLNVNVQGTKSGIHSTAQAGTQGGTKSGIHSTAQAGTKTRTDRKVPGTTKDLPKRKGGDAPARPKPGTERRPPRPGPKQKEITTQTTPKTQPGPAKTAPGKTTTTTPQTAPKPGPGTKTTTTTTPAITTPETKPETQTETTTVTKPEPTTVRAPATQTQTETATQTQLEAAKARPRTQTQTQTQTQAEAKPSRITRTAGAKVPPLSGRSAPSGISRISPVPGPAEAAGRRLTIEDDTAELRENRKTAGGTRLSSPGARTRARVGADTRGEDRGQSRQPITGFQRMVKEAVQDAFLDLRK
jgi:HK97 family phage prohead protease